MTSGRVGLSGNGTVAAKAAPGLTDPLVAALRQRRQQLGLSQDEVAGVLGGQNAVHRWETGKISPMLYTLRRWAAALDCRIELVPLTSPPLVTDELVGLRPAKWQHRQIVADMTARGASAIGIAERLGITERQVQRHRARLREVA